MYIDIKVMNSHTFAPLSTTSSKKHYIFSIPSATKKDTHGSKRLHFRVTVLTAEMTWRTDSGDRRMTGGYISRQDLRQTMNDTMIILGGVTSGTTMTDGIITDRCGSAHCCC